ncbi:MAG TPA: glycosyl hydrolase family 65 protein, partial [Solirubrobacteraceae bacterium]|nr:glycosyl hydrolase family 65 protein [Solirubrobacteraceae bacterium]
DVESLAQTESLFALSNGHIGLRGNLDEGEPFGLPGTYLAGFYEVRQLPYAEPGYGYPDAGQTVVNVTNGKIMRLLVEDEAFDVRYGELRRHERLLDMRAGTLRRSVEWVSPAGRPVRVTSTRIVSLSRRAIAAILYEVDAVDQTTAVVVQSELVTNEAQPATAQDPRAATALKAPLEACSSDHADDRRAILVHVTAESELRVAAAMDHIVEGPPGTQLAAESFPDLGRVTITAAIEPGKPLRIVKLVAYGWSAARSVPALRDQVGAAVADARRVGWAALVAEQRAFLDAFWAGADVVLEGDAELQQAVRFALFHILQAGARTERRAIAAKGLTGTGYDGHAFWDSESFVLQPLTYTVPEGARDALLWRHSTLATARKHARDLGLRGAAFAWRTIEGEECSGYWPAGTAAFHINADIADAVSRYLAASEDEEFARGAGLELLVETARLWRSLGHHDAAGRFRIDGVTGPDEYSAVADNNLYTNLMAQKNLRAAAELALMHAGEAAALEVDEEETASWRDAAEAMVVPFDEKLGVHPQAEGFTEHALWDFAATAPEQYPLLLHFPYFELYRRQVVKQADLVLALHLCGDAFSAAEKLRDFDYYERITVRDSSLSACTQAVIAAEVGLTELAYDYLTEAALIDLDDIQHDTRDGLHIASLAGTWIAIVAGLGGMRDHGGRLSFAPRLPQALSAVSFRIAVRGRILQVAIDQREAVYTLRRGGRLEILHHGTAATVTPRRRLRLAVPELRAPPARPRQPVGRAPRRGRARDEAQTETPPAG